MSRIEFSITITYKVTLLKYHDASNGNERNTSWYTTSASKTRNTTREATSSRTTATTNDGPIPPSVNDIYDGGAFVGARRGDVSGIARPIGIGGIKGINVMSDRLTDPFFKRKIGLSIYE